MNFKGVQILRKDSDKFSKILPWIDIHKSEFSWEHMYVRIRFINKYQKTWFK
jgi:hypothetical protein